MNAPEAAIDDVVAQTAVPTQADAPASAGDAPLVFVILLNGNGWADTLVCLESVFRSDDPRFRVIVCDDDSLERIREWAWGHRGAADPVRRLLWAAVPALARHYDRVAWRPEWPLLLLALVDLATAVWRWVRAVDERALIAGRLRRSFASRA